MCTYLSVLLFFGVTLCCSTANETTFVNVTKSQLNILAVFGHPGKSHFDVFKPLLEELARRDHDITVLSYFPRTKEAKAKEALPTYKDINLNNPEVSIFVEIIDLHNISYSFFHIIESMFLIRHMADIACRGLNHSAVKELLRTDEKFDLIITESFNTDCFLGFVYKFKAPFITLSSHQIMPWTNDNMANEENPSYIPMIFTDFTRPMNYLGRTTNMLLTLFAKTIYNYWFQSIDNAVAREIFGSDLPDVRSIASQSQALLVNTHNSLHGSRPQLPNVVEVGGLHIPSKVKPLPRDIVEFLDSAPEGVLYFSLGSMIKATTIPQKKLDVILDVLGSIPRKVLWKWEGDKLPRKIDNVMTRRWLPQFDVLNHPNIRCFMGHGGLLGVSESVYAGVPMILIPMYGDQFHNAAVVKTRESAIILKFNDLDNQSLRHALDEIFNNTRYRENAQRLSKAYRDRPATPLETSVWWAEYSARGNGRPFLRSDAADLFWYQYLHIDVALGLIIVTASLIYILFRLMRLLLWFVKGVLGSKAKQKSKQEKKD